MLMQEWFSDGFAVQVPAGTSVLDAEMQVPLGANGLIILCHAGSRTRGMQRVQNLADHFIKEGFGILVMDLLTEEEEEIGKQAESEGAKTDDFCFDTDMLSERLYDSLDWLRDLPEARGLPLGLFGSGPGAWAALSVAAMKPAEVSAVVAAGIVPPLDTRILSRIKPPTLILAGEETGPEAALARACYSALPGRKRIECVTGLTKTRDDARANERIARHAAGWFGQNLN
jgi:dienelactone hydrolase